MAWNCSASNTAGILWILQQGLTMQFSKNPNKKVFWEQMIHFLNLLEAPRTWKYFNVLFISKESPWPNEQWRNGTMRLRHLWLYNLLLSRRPKPQQLKKRINSKVVHKNNNNKTIKTDTQIIRVLQAIKKCWIKGTGFQGWADI